MNAEIRTLLDVGGIATRSTEKLDIACALGMELVLPAGKAGTLSTRTSNTAGTLTLSTGHGLAQYNVVDLFWSGGSRRNVAVGVVSGLSVPISGGTGDNLPAQDDAIVAAKQAIGHLMLNGELLAALIATCEQEFQVRVLNGIGTEVIANAVVAAGEPFQWLSAQFGANPLFNDLPTRIVASQAGTAADATLKVGLGIDAQYSNAVLVSAVVDTGDGTLIMRFSEELLALADASILAGVLTVIASSKYLDFGDPTTAVIAGKTLTFTGVAIGTDPATGSNRVSLKAGISGLSGLLDANKKIVAPFDDAVLTVQA